MTTPETTTSTSDRPDGVEACEPGACEHCQLTGHPLTASGYCPVCAAWGCVRGDGDQVGLPTPADVGAAVEALRHHLTDVHGTSEQPNPGCLVCVLASPHCPECGQRTDEMTGEDLDLHTVGEAGVGVAATVAIGCEGYVVAAVRAAALITAAPLQVAATTRTVDSAERPFARLDLSGEPVLFVLAGKQHRVAVVVVEGGAVWVETRRQVRRSGPADYVSGKGVMVSLAALGKAAPDIAARVLATLAAAAQDGVPALLCEPGVHGTRTAQDTAHQQDATRRREDGAAALDRRAVTRPGAPVVLGDVHGPALPVLPVGSRVRTSHGRTGTVVGGSPMFRSGRETGYRTVLLDGIREPATWDCAILSPLGPAVDPAWPIDVARHVAARTATAAAAAFARARVLSHAFYDDDPAAVERLAEYREAHHRAAEYLFALAVTVRAARLSGRSTAELSDVTATLERERRAVAAMDAVTNPLAALLITPSWHAGTADRAVTRAAAGAAFGELGDRAPRRSTDPTDPTTGGPGT